MSSQAVAFSEPVVHVLLCDKATNDPSRGTLNLLNAGFTISPLMLTPAGPAIPPHTVTAFIRAPLALCNKDLPARIELRDEDGNPVIVPGPGGPQPLSITHVVRIPPVPDAPTGFPGMGTLMVELNFPIPLAPGRWYSWQVTIAEVRGDAGFWVPKPPMPPVVG